MQPVSLSTSLSFDNISSENARTVSCIAKALIASGIITACFVLGWALYQRNVNPLPQSGFPHILIVGGISSLVLVIVGLRLAEQKPQDPKTLFLKKLEDDGFNAIFPFPLNKKFVSDQEIREKVLASYNKSLPNRTFAVWLNKNYFLFAQEEPILKPEDLIGFHEWVVSSLSQDHLSYHDLIYKCLGIFREGFVNPNDASIAAGLITHFSEKFLNFNSSLPSVIGSYQIHDNEEIRYLMTLIFKGFGDTSNDYNQTLQKVISNFIYEDFPTVSKYFPLLPEVVRKHLETKLSIASTYFTIVPANPEEWRRANTDWENQRARASSEFH